MEWSGVEWCGLGKGKGRVVRGRVVWCGDGGERCGLVWCGVVCVVCGVCGVVWCAVDRGGEAMGRRVRWGCGRVEWGWCTRWGGDEVGRGDEVGCGGDEDG